MKFIILILTLFVMSCSSVKEKSISLTEKGLQQYLVDSGFTEMIEPTKKNIGHYVYVLYSYCAMILELKVNNYRNPHLKIYGLVPTTKGEYTFITLCQTNQTPTPAYGYLCDQIPGMKFARIENNLIICGEDNALDSTN